MDPFHFLSFLKYIYLYCLLKYLFVLLYDFEEFDCQESNNYGKSQLDLYLEEPRISCSGNFDVLGYWKDRSNGFGDLARMICDVLSIPITTMTSEYAFSIGSRVLNKYRSKMLDKTVQALICTWNWLHGFVGKFFY